MTSRPPAKPLFDPPAEEPLGPGAMLLRRFASLHEKELLSDIEVISASAPFRRMVTPGGLQIGVAMTNCGDAGWVSDRKGYRYDRLDPETGKRWPAMTTLFRREAERAAAAAGYTSFAPDVCLINRYEPGIKLSLHQDRDEQDFDAPIVSFSLGLPGRFLFGGNSRKDPLRRLWLESGDVVVWGGPSRLAYHGIDPLKEGTHPLTGRYRFNLTFRRALR